MDIETMLDDVAIVGMACRVAGAGSPSELWENLVQATDVQSEITRFAGYYHPDGGRRKGLTNVNHAYTINEGLEQFDNAFFSITPVEAVAMDVQQRLLLEVTYEAFENAGIALDRVRGTDTAVYTGVLGTTDYASSILRDLDATPKYTATGASSAILANRISYFFDLHGASMIVDTACSSTIVALHQAIAAIRAGESKMAVVTGANVLLDAAMFVHMSELGFLSPTGRCRSFDAGGDGYARGEGVLAIILKPVRDAIRDGDTIRAVVKATRINQDGRTQGLTLPSSEAQRANLESIYAASGISPLDVQYVEAHGTGTAVGDPLELSAINAVFTKDREDELLVGSIKSNVGHLEASAALAGIMKTVLALEHRKIPPQMHLETLNPGIDWSKTRVPRTVEEWPIPRSGKHLGAVNSFGFGGTNGHAILERFSNKDPSAPPYDRPYLFMLSANSVTSLDAMQDNLARYVEKDGIECRSLAHTLLARRSLLKFSRFITAATQEQLVKSLHEDKGAPVTRSEEAASDLTFVFTGQGAQWPQMGAQMIRFSPFFKSLMVDLDRQLQELPDPPEWSIVEELLKSKESSRVYISSFSQPLCTAIQVGLVALLASWGIRPRSVIGHSSGEVAAAYAAGALSRRDAIVVAYYRGLFLGAAEATDNTKRPEGGMCAIGLSETDAREFVGRRVALAAVNSPSSCTLSGDFDAIQEIVEQCQSTGTFCRSLRVDMAYHSHHMLPKSALYQRAMESAGVRPIASSSSCQMFSSVYGRCVEPGELSPAYWKDNMVNTVKFHQAMTALVNVAKPQIILEIGPHAALAGPAGDSLAAAGVTDLPYSGTLARGKPDFESLLTAAGFLLTHRYPIDTIRVNASERILEDQVHYETGTVLVDLPPYQWDHTQTFSGESRLSRNTRYRDFPRHELLGVRLPADNPLQRMWRNLLMKDEVTWLQELVDRGHVHFPEVLYVQMAMEAGRQACALTAEIKRVRLENVSFGEVLPLSVFASGTTAVETSFSLSQIDESAFQFSAAYCSDSAQGTWHNGCSGTLRLLPSGHCMPKEVVSVTHSKEALQYYESFGGDIVDQLSMHQVNIDAISGAVLHTADDLEGYCVDPPQLASIAKLPQYLLAAQQSPSFNRFRLQSISGVEFPAGSWHLSTGVFRIDVRSCSAVAGVVDLHMIDDDYKQAGLQFVGMQWSRLEEISYHPPLRSLFFSDCLAPDISTLSTGSKMNLRRAIQLTTHKWPMADIFLTSLTERALHQILSLLHMYDNHRPRHRSVAISCDDYDFLPEGDVLLRKSIKDLDPETLHMAIGGIGDLPKLINAAIPGGIVLVANEDFCTIDEEELDVIATFEEIDLTWTVTRRSVAKSRTLPRTIIFATNDTPARVLPKSAEFEVVQLNPSSQWIPPSEPVGVIVLDFGQKSLLVDWDGTSILSWIQSLLERTTHLLWVGRDTEHHVAPSFTKTICAEHPEIKASSLLVATSTEPLDVLIHERFQALVAGRAEPEEYFSNNVLNIKRYQPDDELSVSVGKLPPAKLDEVPDGNSYEIAIVAKGQIGTVIQRSLGLSQGIALEIRTCYSLVDSDDIRTFRTGHVASTRRPRRNLFCAGIIERSTSPRFPKGTWVLAVVDAAHSERVYATESQVMKLDSSCAVVDDLVKRYFASLVTSIFATVRAIPGDRFCVQPHGPLATIIDRWHSDPPAQASQYPNREFHIDVSVADGILIDGHPLQSHQLILDLGASKSLSNGCDVPIKQFSISEAQSAFEFAQQNPTYPVVLDHGKSGLPGPRLCYAKQQLFRPDRAYIIVGLGGLARHVAAWMARSGAKHIYALSRRGMLSNDAPRIIEELKALDCEARILSADASDFDSLSAAFEAIRMERAIGGILNMVMILGDSPLLTMAPEKWDQCVGSKVKSTVNTHTASLDDDLEFFIMFSSIASISGNRMQANYATANAYQNAFAQYRHRLGRTGVAIALGAITGVGVLANDHALLRTISQAGFYHLNGRDLEKILEAAIYESRSRDRSLLTTGFNMFKSLDGVVQAKPEQNQLYWTASAEFGFLLKHDRSGIEGKASASIKDKLSEATDTEAADLLLDGLLLCLSNVLGYEPSAFDPKSPVSVYGFDSLNAVSVRYWFYTQLGLSVPVFDILGCKSINELVSRIVAKFRSTMEQTRTVTIPEPKRNIEPGTRPLSHSQQRLFFLHRFIPDKTIFNLLLVCEAQGTMNVDRFIAAWEMFFIRHEVLYSRIVSTDDGFQQLPVQDPKLTIEHIRLADHELDALAEEHVRSARALTYDPEAGQLLHGYIFESPVRSKFLIASHHLAWDRSSAPTVFAETQAIYKALSAGEDPLEALDPAPIQFVDYALWQNECIANPDVLEPQVDYWKQKLEGAPEAVSLLPAAIHETRPSMKAYQEESVFFSFEPSLTGTIKEFCKANAATPFMFLTTVLAALVHKLTGDEDIVINIADGDRGHSAFDKLIGFTVNMLPIRSKPRSDLRFLDLLEEYRTACLEAYEHRSIPFDYLLQVLQIPRRTAHSPVAQIAVNYQMQGAYSEVDYGDFQFTRFDHYNARIQTDFGLDIEEAASSELRFTIAYDPNIYDHAGMQTFARQYQATVQSVVDSDGTAVIGAICIDSSAELELIRKALYPHAIDRQLLCDDLFPTLFKQAVDRFPTKIAIQDSARSVTYAELDAKTASLAIELDRRGVRNGNALGVYCEQSVAMLIAIYGIVRAGCAYVPIDPDTPEARIESMIEDAAIQYVLVDSIDDRTMTLLACGMDTENVLEIDSTSMLHSDAALPGALVAADDPFCYIFTSGSTGKPKGIKLSHGMLLCQQKAYNRLLESSADDRIALGVAMVFDLSLCSIFGSILLGATTIVARRAERYNAAKMIDMFVDERVTSTILSPTQLKALFTAPNRKRMGDWTSLRTLTSCGEALPPWIVQEFHRLNLTQAKFYNAYAPAETTVVNSLALMQAEDGHASDCYIGSPLSTNKFYLLDSHRNAVPLGVPGELYIGGLTVATGYLNRKELSETVFHDDPWATEDEKRNGFDKIYQTGDSFKITCDGRLHCLGRIGGDRQVKIRGMRTELGDIESAIFEAGRQLADTGPRLSLAAVVYPKNKTGESILTAYLTLDQDVSHTVDEQRGFEAYVRTTLIATLPSHMVPALFISLPSMPKTGSNKTDYKALLQLPLPVVKSGVGRATVGKPLTKLQQKIAAVWRDHLHLEGNLAPEDNFFTLGGHSMMIINISNGIQKQTGVELDLADMFAQPTVSGMENLVLAAAPTMNGALTNGLTNGVISNGFAPEDISRKQPESSRIDWIQEASMKDTADWFIEQPIFQRPTAIAMTGACTMIGAHFLRHVLSTTGVFVYCIAVDTPTDSDPLQSIVASLQAWKLESKISSGRVRAFPGSLSSPMLGLDHEQRRIIDRDVQAIYHLDSDVSLIKNYNSIREGNVGAIHHLLELAASAANNPKPIHYLSTWGVPHLQAWHSTSLSSPRWMTGESEMSQMIPGATADMGYLKCRWACEALLSSAAKRGVPVTIVRTTMCAPSPSTGACIEPSDINRRILMGSLEVGAVPDVASSQGGGMNWMTADVLVRGIWHLTHRKTANTGKPNIRHVISKQHILYTELADMLSTSSKPLESVPPTEWLRRLKQLGGAQRSMHAAVVGKWCDAGWIPFPLDSHDTMLELEKAGIRPHDFDHDLLMRLVIGQREF